MRLQVLTLAPLFLDPSIQLKAGDLIQIQAVGGFSYSYGQPSTTQTLLGVFADSSGNFLAPGINSTVASVVSLPTYYGGYSTDIPQDFNVPFDAPAVAQVPVGATKILFSPNDAHFADNSDDGSYGVDIVVTIKSFDLGISAPVISQSQSSLGSDGLVNIVPGIPAQIGVAISGSGFNSPELRSVVVSVNAGSQTLQQTVALSQLVATGTQFLTFNVTFAAADKGIQTIFATIDPGNLLQESNFSNNAASTQVRVQPHFKLIANLNGSQAPDTGGSLVLAPSINGCGALARSVKDIPVQIQCVTSGTNQLVNGCGFMLKLSVGANDGGHAHDTVGEPRPLVLGPLTPNFQTDTLFSVDTKGSSLIYQAPEISGDVFLEISGLDPYGNSIQGPSFTFQIQSPLTLQHLSASGLTITTKSHPGAGDYGTVNMQNAVSEMVAEYYDLAKEKGVNSPDALASEAATLVNGGLFDIDKDWQTPHCGHRDGQTIDLSLSVFTGPNADKEKAWLQKAAVSAGFNFTVPGERPQDINATHWHATLK